MIVGFDRAVNSMCGESTPNLREVGFKWKKNACRNRLQEIWESESDMDNESFFTAVIYLSNYIILKVERNPSDVLESGDFDYVVSRYPEYIHEQLESLLHVYQDIIFNLGSKSQEESLATFMRNGYLGMIMKREEII